MNKSNLKAALRAITTATPRKGGNPEKRLPKLIAALAAGEHVRKARDGGEKVQTLNAARTVLLAAQVLRLGGTVPSEVCGRFPLGAARTAILAVATEVGCDGEALFAALVPALAEQPEPEAAPVVPIAEGGRRTRR